MPRLVALDATGPSFVAALLRTWDRGDAVLPVDPRLPAPARDRLLRALGADDEVDPGDALVVATSGTTGDPKGVVLTMAAVEASARATSERIGVTEDDSWLACLPLAHVGGLSVVTRALLTETRLVVHEGFEPTAVAASGTSLVSLVPTALQRIDPTLFRVIVLGGQAPPDARPANAVTTYGMTETGSGVVYDGRPLSGVDVRVDAAGRIALRGPMLLRCYRDGTDPKDADGWLDTGDIGELVDGRLRVFGRDGDMIITGGENVWPGPVERVIGQLPGVADVAVVGRPDPEWGERVVAVVVPAGAAHPPSLDEVRSAVKEVLPAFMAPKELELVDALPTTSLGKVRRNALR